MAAGLFTRGALKAVGATPGYRLDDKLLVEMDPRVAGYDGARVRQVCQALMGRVKELPGVQAVALSTSPPFYGHQGAGPVTEYGAPPKANASADRREVDALYVDGDFSNLWTTPSPGRYFSPVDHVPSTATPVIIDEPLARRLRAGWERGGLSDPMGGFDLGVRGHRDRAGRAVFAAERSGHAARLCPAL